MSHGPPGGTSLTRLDLDGNLALASVGALAGCRALTQLNLSDTAVADLSPLAGIAGVA